MMRSKTGTSAPLRGNDRQSLNGNLSDAPTNRSLNLSFSPSARYVDMFLCWFSLICIFALFCRCCNSLLPVMHERCARYRICHITMDLYRLSLPLRQPLNIVRSGKKMQFCFVSLYIGISNC